MVSQQEWAAFEARQRARKQRPVYTGDAVRAGDVRVLVVVYCPRCPKRLVEVIQGEQWPQPHWVQTSDMFTQPVQLDLVRDEAVVRCPRDGDITVDVIALRGKVAAAVETGDRQKMDGIQRG